MQFLKSLIARFRKSQVEAAPMAEVEDIFALRLRKLEGRSQMTVKSSPFKTARQHRAA